MILIEELLSLDAIFASLKAGSRRHAFETMIDHLAVSHALDRARALGLLLEREKLGSTAIGDGVALPHALVEGIDGALGCFARLDKPIGFDAPDDKPVDLLFLLLVDTAHGAQHARTIAHISLVMSQKPLQDALRRSKKRDEIFELLKSFEHSATRR